MLLVILPLAVALTGTVLSQEICSYNHQCAANHMCSEGTCVNADTLRDCSDEKPCSGANEVCCEEHCIVVFIPCLHTHQCGINQMCSGGKCVSTTSLRNCSDDNPCTEENEVCYEEYCIIGKFIEKHCLMVIPPTKSSTATTQPSLSPPIEEATKSSTDVTTIEDTTLSPIQPDGETVREDEIGKSIAKQSSATESTTAAGDTTETKGATDATAGLNSEASVESTALTERTLPAETATTTAIATQDTTVLKQETVAPVEQTSETFAKDETAVSTLESAVETTTIVQDTTHTVQVTLQPIGSYADTRDDSPGELSTEVTRSGEITASTPEPVVETTVTAEESTTRVTTVPAAEAKTDGKTSENERASTVLPTLEEENTGETSPSAVVTDSETRIDIGDGASNTDPASRSEATTNVPSELSTKATNGDDISASTAEPEAASETTFAETDTGGKASGYEIASTTEPTLPLETTRAGEDSTASQITETSEPDSKAVTEDRSITPPDSLTETAPTTAEDKPELEESTTVPTEPQFTDAVQSSPVVPSFEPTPMTEATLAAEETTPENPNAGTVSVEDDAIMVITPSETTSTSKVPTTITPAAVTTQPTTSSTSHVPLPSQPDASWSDILPDWTEPCCSDREAYCELSITRIRCLNPNTAKALEKDCPLTCGACGGRIECLPEGPFWIDRQKVPWNVPTACRDKLFYCSSLVHLCEHRSHYNFMTKNCPRTCGRCPATKFRHRSCADNDRLLEDFSCSESRHLCNNRFFYNQMTMLCPKTCGRCHLYRAKTANMRETAPPLWSSLLDRRRWKSARSEGYSKHSSDYIIDMR